MELGGEADRARRLVSQRKYSDRDHETVTVFSRSENKTILIRVEIIVVAVKIGRSGSPKIFKIERLKIVPGQGESGQDLCLNVTLSNVNYQL